MSTAYLGQPFDIHTGGIDLAFPHHENEIAQSREANGKPLANFFVHGEHLLIDGQKMAKSAKNFYTVDDIIRHGFEPLAFRMLVLQAHYRSQLNFSWESLAAAQTNLKGLRAWADQQFQHSVKTLSTEQITTAKKAIIGSLNEDLESPAALAVVNGLTDKGAPTKQLLDYLDSLLGLNLSDRQNINKEETSLIEQREVARQSQDWPEADRIRAELLEQRIEINDTNAGPVWARI